MDKLFRDLNNDLQTHMVRIIDNVTDIKLRHLLLINTINYDLDIDTCIEMLVCIYKYAGNRKPGLYINKLLALDETRLKYFLDDISVSRLNEVLAENINTGATNDVIKNILINIDCSICGNNVGEKIKTYDSVYITCNTCWNIIQLTNLNNSCHLDDHSADNSE